MEDVVTCESSNSGETVNIRMNENIKGLLKVLGLPEDKLLTKLEI